MRGHCTNLSAICKLQLLLKCDITGTSAVGCHERESTNTSLVSRVGRVSFKMCSDTVTKYESVT